ncbi:cob(I)yrinic acid a,c-diamide adenosyltransferase [Desulfonema limicola]|uniref:cob(I)yrinic acid a,c-diamide adenosyltransferase n=1 Tax=Desulfonema limicola TaxID=45656 RepID=UPI001A9C0C5A|nr:cob(I)yrinic acid a,c-diamide adenosyltransferase [Desulfonema limicola]
MKVYTGTGDQGQTSLFSGERVKKCHDRVEAYGELDELNSFMGAIAASMPDEKSEEQRAVINEIQQIQSDLLIMGAVLATTPESPAFKSLKKFDREKSRQLELAIDRMDSVLPQLKSFILPGGHISSAWAHIARTVCRRAERRIISLDYGKEQDLIISFQEILIYINRLSDYLFMLGRYCNYITSTADISWKKD